MSGSQKLNRVFLSGHRQGNNFRAKGGELFSPAVRWCAPGLLLVTLLIGAATLSLIINVYARPSALGVIFQPGEFAVLINTVIICAGVTAVVTVTGWILGVTVRFASHRVTWVIIAVTLCPLLVDQIVRNYAFYFIFRSEGIWAHALRLFGVQSPPQVLYTRLGIVIGISHGLINLAVIPIWLSLRRLSDSSVHAAWVHGATWWRLLLDLVMPASLPGVVVGAFFVFVFTLGYYVTPKMLGGRSGLMISALIDDRINTLGDWYGGAALSLFVLVLCLPFMLLTPWVLRLLERQD